MTTAHTIHVQGLEKSYQDARSAARRGPRRGAGQHLRPARLQRRRQDHPGEDPLDAAQGRRGDGQRRRLRRRRATGEGAGLHQPHRAVRGRGRDPQRAGEPRAGRPAPASRGPGHDRGGPAGALLADRRRRAEGLDVLRGHAPTSRHRDEPDRGSAGDLPRRADDRPRPAGADRGVAGRSRSSPVRARRCCSPPSTSTRPNSSPTGSPSSTRAGSSRTAPSPSSSGSCRPPRSSTSRSSRPWRTSSWRSSATTARHGADATDKTDDSLTTKDPR